MSSQAIKLQIIFLFKMKIGLLECDHVRDELRHIAGDYRQMFPALFEEAAPNWEWRFYDVVNGHFPDSINDCDAYFCSGSRFSVYDDAPWIEQLKTFVKLLYDAKKPFIGVCFGHQVLAEALGGKVQKAETGWCVGVHAFEKVSNKENNSPFPTLTSTLHLLMMCQDQVVALPPNSTVLASTADCAVGIFQVSDLMLGIQAHPEFTTAYETALINLRVEQIGQEKAQKALASLAQPTDGALLAREIVVFLTQFAGFRTADAGEVN